MDYDETTPQYSDTEGHLQRLVMPTPAGYDTSKRIDVIHEPNLDLLRGSQ